MDRPDWKAALGEALEHAVAYLESLPERPVRPAADLAQLRGEHPFLAEVLHAHSVERGQVGGRLDGGLRLLEQLSDAAHRAPFSLARKIRLLWLRSRAPLWPP